MNVALDWNGVAVIQVQPERLGVELVDEALARADRLEGAVHARGVNPVEVDAVRMAALVDEPHPQPVALGTADGWTGYLAVVGPRGIEDAWRHLDFTVFGHQLVLPQHLTRGETGHLAGIEAGEEGAGVE